MNRQRGASSLLLVLLLLIAGSTMLKASHHRYQFLLSDVTLESRALANSARAESLLQWGRQREWHADQAVQCQHSDVFSGTLCLRIFADAGALLIADSGGQRRWQSGYVNAGSVQFSPHGWSDFCPRKEAAECRLP